MMRLHNRIADSDTKTNMLDLSDPCRRCRKIGLCGGRPRLLDQSSFSTGGVFMADGGMHI
jgi:hypothetical protein